MSFHTIADQQRRDAVVRIVRLAEVVDATDRDDAAAYADALRDLQHAAEALLGVMAAPARSALYAAGMAAGRDAHPTPAREVQS